MQKPSSRSMYLGSLAALGLLASVVLLARCGNDAPDPGKAATPSSAGSTASAISAPPVASSAAPAASSAPVPSAEPSASAPIADAPPDAGAKAVKDAGAPPVAAKDAGAPDGGKTASAGDAGAANPVSPGGKIARDVDAVFANRKTFSARFKQEYNAKIANIVKNSSGTVLVEKPYKVSFRYDAPNKNRIVSDGTTIKVYIAEDNQMFETPVEKTQYPGALGFMMGNGIATSFSFVISDKPKFDPGPVLKGTPLAPNPSYEYVMFFIDSAMLARNDPAAMSRVLIVDAQGNRNKFDFEGATQPATIDPAEFTFTPPAGTDIKR